MDTNQGLYRSIAEDWKTGHYTIAELMEQYSLSRKELARILRNGGTSINDKQYRNKRIGELYSAGHDAKHLAARYGLSKKYVVTVAWRGAGRERQRVCPECGRSFAPSDNRRRHCSDKCKGNRKPVSGICVVCGGTFRSHHPEQQCCSQRCNAAFVKIQRVDRNLKIRDMKRKGHTYRELTEIFGLSRGALSEICRPGAYRSKHLSAVETVRRHRGRAWLSEMARMDMRRAEAILKKQGSYNYFCSV